MTTSDRRQHLAEFLATQPVAAGVDPGQVMTAETRDELGISSLNMILVLVNYIKERADGSIEIRPEWVSCLDEVDGILTVIDEIDALATAGVGAD